MPDGYVCTKGNREKFCKAKLGDLTKIRTTVANSRGVIELVSIELLGDEDNHAAPMMWGEVRFDRGCIELPDSRVKNGQAREIYFKETPALEVLLKALHEVGGGVGPVFGLVSIPMLDLVVKRTRNRSKR